MTAGTPLRVLRLRLPMVVRLPVVLRLIVLSLALGLVTAGQGLVSPAAAATTGVGISTKPTVSSWGVKYAFVHQGGTLTVAGSIRPARSARLTLQQSTDGRTWTYLTRATTDAAGNTSTRLRPTLTRHYRWVLPAAGSNPAVVSATVRPVVYPKAQVYRRCADLNRHYPHGVGKPGARDRTADVPVRHFLPSAAVYALNDGGRGQSDLDRDNDGISCEKL